MAAYGKEEFYYGSDFSDFSEDDADLNEVSDGSIGSDEEDDILCHCVCNLPASTDMIACDSSRCKIEWFHYECVGLTSATIPDGSWYCGTCQANENEQVLLTMGEGLEAELFEDTEATACTSKQDPASRQTGTESVEGGGSQNQNQTTGKKAKSTTKSKKSASKGEKKKSSVERPAKLFSVKNAKDNAAGYLKTALERIQEHPIFTGKYPLAISVLTLVASVLHAKESAEFVNFSVTLITALWLIATAGDDKFLQPEAMDFVWKKFHEFKLNPTHVHHWNSFIKSIGISTDGSHVNIVYQHILLTIITLLIKDRHATDLPATSLNNQETLSKEEEQVLRYVAGYVPFALCEKFRKQLNDTAAVFCKILATWRSCTTNSEKTFLEYSNEWIQVQNRGGLFVVNDDVYIFFRTIENEARPFLSKGNLENCVGRNIKRDLKDKMMLQTRVHNYWCNLTRGRITGTVSKRLLDIVVNLYIKIRIKAFLKVYLDLKKAKGKISKKSEKALRKNLAS